jgi:hypothetical protein
VLTAGQATAQTTAAVILSKLQKIVNISRSERKPFPYALGLSGAPSKLIPRPGTGSNLK